MAGPDVLVLLGVGNLVTERITAFVGAAGGPTGTARFQLRMGNSL